MRKIRLFQDQKLDIEQQVTLDEAATHRLLTVLRLKKNDSITLFNGENYEYNGVITTLDRKKVIVTLRKKIETHCESHINIHLGQVVSKGEKMDWIVQKATELGVKKITPLFSQRSLLQMNAERLEKKMDHWKKIILHASEQCGRTFLPTLELPKPLLVWIKERHKKTCVVLDPHSTHTFQSTPLSETIALLIGPEGGLCEEEIEEAHTHRFHRVKLGPRILRMETAALAAIATLQAQIGDFIK